MKVLGFILQKEFRQIFRDKSIVAMIFILPIIQLGILPVAMNFEVKNVNIAIVNNDHSTLSYKLINKIGASGYFKIVSGAATYKQSLELIKLGKADMILEIPAGFEKNLVRENFQKVNLSVDAINGTKSSLGSTYLISVITDFNEGIRVVHNQNASEAVAINIEPASWFNPYENYHWYIVPGILAFLLTVFAGSISTLNIVKEKEVGTIEQINVTPIKKWQFLLGKLIPFWIMGMIILTIGLLVAVIFYGMRPIGSIAVLYALSALYLMALLGFGLFISTISENQLQAMFTSFFFIMIFVLMSGLFTSVESMPGWARSISQALPITYFMKAVRMIMLKGSTFNDLGSIFLILAGFTIVLNGLAIWNYRKTN